MVEPETTQFWKVALRSGLLDDSALQAAWSAIPLDKRDDQAVDRRMARQLVNTGGLTLWQAQQLLAGRSGGLKIEKYILLNVIGHGGMGRVYLAKDTRLGRLVALKILSRERMNSPRALARFRREAKVGAQLQHENLVRIYDEGESFGVQFLVMEFIEGRTVGQMIVEHGRLPAGTCADIARQVCHGLDHLHQKGLLHRDVNPMNILIDRNGTAKLTDLGLAIDTGDAEDMVTRDGATVGTFDYIAPEQAKHSRAADERSDVYSLGCSLYHMLSGQVPFPVPSLPEKLYAHQLSEPEPISSIIPTVPPGLEAIIRKSMRKLPEQRYGSPMEMARALEPFARVPVAADGTAEESVDSNGVPVPATVVSSAVMTPAGSDPDLDLNRAQAAATPPNPPPTDPMDFITKLDFGPRLPLSGTRTSSSYSITEIDLNKYRRVAIAALGAAAIAGLIFLTWSMKDRIASLFRYKSASAQSIEPPKNDDKVAVDEPKPTSTASDVITRFPGGQEIPHATLGEAIQRSAGREQSEILLRNKTPVQLGTPGKTLLMTWGHMVIRGGENTSPDLVIKISGKEPWIEVGTQASLKLVGLRIQVDVVSPPASAAPPLDPSTLIQANGNIRIERCTFFTTGIDRRTRVVAGEGLNTQLEACHFDGFDQPVLLRMYPDTKVNIGNCLFVRDPTASLAAGWAIAANRQVSPASNSRLLTIDRCTVLGTGLLTAEGFDPANSLQVSIKNTVIKARALILTTPNPPELIAKSLRWSGKENWYEIAGPSWTVALPDGVAGLPGMPTNLKSWKERMDGEPGTREELITFQGSALAEGRSIEDFAVKIDPGKTFIAGIDPASVGPAVKSTKP